MNLSQNCHRLRGKLDNCSVIDRNNNNNDHNNNDDNDNNNNNNNNNNNDNNNNDNNNNNNNDKLMLVLLGVLENLSAMLEMIFSPVIVQRHTQGTVHDELCRQGVKF